MLWWGQPTDDLHEPQAYTAQDDQQVEQLNQSHKANMGGDWGRLGAQEEEGESLQPRLSDLSIRLVRGRGCVAYWGQLLWPLDAGP